jgi:hypothetical protein
VSIVYQSIIAILLSCIVSIAGAAQNPLSTCPEFPVPDKAKIQIVAQQMEINGLPMAIKHLESTDAPNVILAFYRGKWAATEKAPAAVEYSVGQWQAIASRRDDCFYSVQVKSFGKNGSEALLGITTKPTGVRVKEAVPMLPGSAVVNDMRHNDGGKTARTVLLRNGFSTATNADFYLRNLTDQGWRVTDHYRMQQPNHYGDAIVLRNGLRELSIVATRDAKNANQSNVLLNYVDQP